MSEKKKLNDEELEKVTGGVTLQLDEAEEVTVDTTTTSLNIDMNIKGTQRTIKEG